MLQISGRAPRVVAGAVGRETSVLRILTAINQIHRQNSSDLSFEELYRSAYQLVIEKSGEYLYDKVKEKITQLTKEVQARLSMTFGDVLLSSICSEWNDFSRANRKTSDILMYMDRNYSVKERKSPVEDIGLLSFRTEILVGDGFGRRFVECLLEQIRRSRMGLQVDTLILKHAIAVMKNVMPDGKSSLYKNMFETRFLEETRSFYVNESQEAGNVSIPEYLKKVEHRLVEERARVESYLLPETDCPLRAILTQCLIHEHYHSIVKSPSGPPAMFRDSKHEDLHRMYRLFELVPEAKNELMASFREFIKNSADGIVNDEVKKKDPVLFVESLFDLMFSFDLILNIAFEDSIGYRQAMRREFETSLNRSTLTAEFLALYIDDLLKKRFRQMTEVEFENTTDRIVGIFQLLNDKDVLQDHCRNLLGKRLLAGGLFLDAEKAIVAKFKSERGATFTSKMEGMFVDIAQSGELMRQFQASQHAKDQIRGASHVPTIAFDFRVNVLTSSFWSVDTASVNIPSAIADSRQAYTDFYATVHSGRKLTWAPSLDHGVLHGRIGVRAYDFCCPAYQMAILLLFNEHVELSRNDAQKILRIPEEEFARHFVSLYMNPKIRILTKGDGSNYNAKEVTGDDKMCVNQNFSSQTLRVKVPLLLARSRGLQQAMGSTFCAPTFRSGSSSEIDNQIQIERIHTIEATAVRLMKTRKTMSHQDLINEVIRIVSSRFCPPVGSIKEGIGKLIEKEFLKRSDSDSNVYEYLA